MTQTNSRIAQQLPAEFLDTDDDAEQSLQPIPGRQISSALAVMVIVTTRVAALQLTYPLGKRR